ncbi:unnamed protein product [Wuchereria bancrofti]|uniref:Uncharacterized protein n=1 Tax=Wuchereria bancrofti TaxID=6293 RepID=A0A3P7ECE2_WUCBA|nr:unnamed protein product [Wuchereria bancrofti]
MRNFKEIFVVRREMLLEQAKRVHLHASFSPLKGPFSHSYPKILLLKSMTKGSPAGHLDRNLDYNISTYMGSDWGVVVFVSYVDTSSVYGLFPTSRLIFFPFISIKRDVKEIFLS